MQQRGGEESGEHSRTQLDSLQTKKEKKEFIGTPGIYCKTVENWLAVEYCTTGIWRSHGCHDQSGACDL